jgi:hypothetical protein
VVVPRVVLAVHAVEAEVVLALLEVLLRDARLELVVTLALDRDRLEHVQVVRHLSNEMSIELLLVTSRSILASQHRV